MWSSGPQPNGSKLFLIVTKSLYSTRGSVYPAILAQDIGTYIHVSLYFHFYITYFHILLLPRDPVQVVPPATAKEF